MNHATINEKYQVSPFYVFFIVHSMQTGVGVLNFQRLLSKSTGTDGWISILLAGLIVHLLIWIIYKIFSIVPGDIIYVNHQAFGKVIGNFFNIVIILYFLILGLIVMISYINVIHLWLFDEVGSWAFALVFLILIYYILTGGFRTITGIAFLSVMLSFWLTFILFYAMRYSEFTNLLPLFDHHILEIVKGLKDTSLTMIGFEVTLMFYPFIKHAKTSQKFAHGGALTTTLLTLFIYIISLIFYSQKQLELTIWPTLTMTSVIQLPFIQRFEYITVSWWALVIIPNLSLSLWAASRGLKVLLNVKQKYPFWVLSIFILFINIAFFDVDSLYVLNKLINPYYVLFFVVYLPFLLIFIYLMKKRNLL